MSDLQDKFEKGVVDNGINCLLFDRRRDDICVMMEIEGCKNDFQDS